jgi:hypothetical protein
LVAPAALRPTAPFCGAATRCCEISGPVAETVRHGPSNFTFLKLYIHAHCGMLCKIQNPSAFGGMLLPPKNPKFCRCASVKTGASNAFALCRTGCLLPADRPLAGRLGFEPRQSASKALDLPLVDRPVEDRSTDSPTRRSPSTSPVFPPGEATLRTLCASTVTGARSP